MKKYSIYFALCTISYTPYKSGYELSHHIEKIQESAPSVNILNCEKSIYNSFLFNESALRPIHSISRDVRLCVCVCVRHTLETTLPEGLESSGRMAYR